MVPVTDYLELNSKRYQLLTISRFEFQKVPVTNYLGLNSKLVPVTDYLGLNVRGDFQKKCLQMHSQKVLAQYSSLLLFFLISCSVFD